MAKGWVDFKQLNEQLDFVAVAEHYGVTFAVKGDQGTARCPLPTHSGNTKDKCFAANFIDGVWICHVCEAKGRTLDFAVRMAGKDPGNPGEVRKVGLELMRVFNLRHEGPKREKPVEKQAAKPATVRRETLPRRRQSRQREAVPSKPVKVNEPLDFSLKDLDPKYPWFANRGLSQKTVEHFGLGYCSRGLMARRIVAPLMDVEGRLIGYAGRLADEREVSETKPLWLFPTERERDGVILRFDPTLFLYHGHRLDPHSRPLLVVADIESVWSLHDQGYSATALMGTTCSPEQARLLVHYTPQGGDEIWIVMASDDSGEACAVDIFRMVAAHRAVRWIPLPPDTNACDLSRAELAERLPDVFE